MPLKMQLKRDPGDLEPRLIVTDENDNLIDDSIVITVTEDDTEETINAKAEEHLINVKDQADRAAAEAAKKTAIETKLDAMTIFNSEKSYSDLEIVALKEAKETPVEVVK